MRVTNKHEFTHKTLGDINRGTLFYLESQPKYIYIEVSPRRTKISSVCLNDGMLFEHPMSEHVVVVEGELIVK